MRQTTKLRIGVMSCLLLCALHIGGDAWGTDGAPDAQLTPQSQVVVTVLDILGLSESAIDQNGKVPGIRSTRWEGQDPNVWSCRISLRDGRHISLEYFADGTITNVFVRRGNDEIDDRTPKDWKDVPQAYRDIVEEKSVNIARSLSGLGFPEFRKATVWFARYEDAQLKRVDATTEWCRDENNIPFYSDTLRVVLSYPGAELCLYSNRCTSQIIGATSPTMIASEANERGVEFVHGLAYKGMDKGLAASGYGIKPSTPELMFVNPAKSVVSWRGDASKRFKERDAVLAYQIEVMVDPPEGQDGYKGWVRVWVDAVNGEILGGDEAIWYQRREDTLMHTR